MDRSFENKYWIFEIFSYYPDGGMSDFCCSMNDLNEAKRFCISEERDHNNCVYEIFDREKREIHFSANGKWQTSLL